jgi:2OG-Fe(II) oxygenase superfamily
MKVKTIDLSSTLPEASRSTTTGLPENGPISRWNPSQMAWVIDDALEDEFLELVDDFRLSLALDTKRPTVKRRFFSSAKQCPAIREGLLAGIRAAISVPQREDDTVTSCHGIDPALEEKVETLDLSGGNFSNSSHSNTINNESISFQMENTQLHILAYMRFLEYDQVGGRLDPHTDGNKICEDTGKQSTHTMLLYLRDCSCGGETVLFETTNKKHNPQRIEAVQPRRGRILLFPHPTLHEGAPTVDVPKICLRAEVSLTLGF